MKTNLILAVLLAAVIVTSGCLDSMEDDELPDEEFEDELPEEPEPEDTETDESETEDEVTNGDQASEETDEETASQVDREITITGGPGTSYDVDEVEVEEGETVEFTYVHEGGTHDLVLERDGEDVASTELYSSGDEGAEESFTYTFEEEGEYQFYCSHSAHRAQGMEGDVVFS